jgi:hypothetical protein
MRIGEPAKRPPSRRIFAEGARELALYRCTVYPTRIATQRCDHCARLFCDEALSDSDWGYVCDVCSVQLERRAELDRTALRRNVFSWNWLPVGIVLGLSLLMAVQLFIVSNGSDLRGDLAVKMRLLFDGADRSKGALVSASAVGGRAYSPAGFQEGHGPEALVDGLAEVDFPAWRSANARFPQDLVLKMNLRTPIATIDILNHPSEPADSYLRQVQVFTSREVDPREDPSGMKFIRQADLDSASSVRIEIPTEVTRYVVLRLLANGGHAEYVSIGEVEVRSRAENDG